MAVIEKIKDRNIGEDEKKESPWCTLDGNVYLLSHYGRQYRVSSQKLKLELTCDPVIPLLGINQKRNKIKIPKRYLY